MPTLDQYATLFNHIASTSGRFTMMRVNHRTLVAGNLRVIIFAKKQQAMMEFTRFYKRPVEKWVWMGSGEIYMRNEISYCLGAGTYRQDIQIKGDIELVLEEFELFCDMLRT